MTRKHLHYVVLPILLLCAWQAIVSLRLVSPLFIPHPLAVVRSLLSSTKDGALLQDAGFTLYRVLVGFALSVLIGVPLGLLMGSSAKIYTALEFLVEFFRGIPTTALFPLFLLVFGIGDRAKFAVTAWGAGLVMVIHSMYGVHLGKELRMKVARTFKIRGFQLFAKVIFPEALPQIFTGMRVALSLALVLVVVTEMFIGTNVGLGKRIIDAQLVYATPDMYAAIIVTGIIGFLLNTMMMFFERKIVHWKGK